MGYKHLTKEQRYTIMVLLQAQATISRIAEVIGKSKGTVSREIRRNSVCVAITDIAGIWLRGSMNAACICAATT